jgi:hypothetical protein
MNIGSAVSDHDEAERHITVIMASPVGRDVNISMPKYATPSKASPIQTPEPSSTNRTKRKRPMA